MYVCVCIFKLWQCTQKKEELISLTYELRQVSRMELSVVLRQGNLVVLWFEKMDGVRDGHPMDLPVSLLPPSYPQMRWISTGTQRGKDICLSCCLGTWTRCVLPTGREWPALRLIGRELTQYDWLVTFRYKIFNEVDSDFSLKNTVACCTPEILYSYESV